MTRAYAILYWGAAGISLLGAAAVVIAAITVIVLDLT